MADVGRSTTTHAMLHSAAVGPEVINSLHNWGNWQLGMATPMAGFPVSPMFREVISGYRESKAREPYDEEEAIIIDKLIAQLPSRDVCVLLLKYVNKRSSRQAAKVMTYLGTECSHTTYRRWVDLAEQRLEDFILLKIS